MSSITFMVNSLNDLSKVAEKIYHLSFFNRIFCLMVRWAVEKQL